MALLVAFAVIAVGAASSRTVPVALGFALGSAAVLLLLAFGGRVVATRIRAAGRGPGLQRVLGGVLVVTAVAMATNLDIRFQSAIARHLPAAVVDPTHSLETSDAVASRLRHLRSPSPFAVAAAHASTSSALPHLGAAPDFTGTQRWFNTPRRRPLTLAGLRGHVVLVDFWTYTCINCIRTLPYLKGLYATYHRYGLQIVGVQTPEFTFEHIASNGAQAIPSAGLRSPIIH